MTNAAYSHGVSTPTKVALVDTVKKLATTRFPLRTDTARDGSALRDQLHRLIDGYLLPRLDDYEAPALVVLAGSTGAGKSTILNSLLGRVISPVDIVRPTTRFPVFVHHPQDERYVTPQRIQKILGSLQSEVSIVSDSAVPPGVILADAPDIDSVEVEHHALGQALIDAADVVLLTTTAVRYADAAPWHVITECARRKTSVGIIMSRVSADNVQTVFMHFGEMLRNAGLGYAPLFTVPEVSERAEVLPEELVTTVRSWLYDVSANNAMRQRLIHRSMAGHLETLPHKLLTLADYVEPQAHVRTWMADVIDGEFTHAHRELQTEITSGEVVQGHVGACWQEFLGADIVFRSGRSPLARLRRSLGATVIRGEDRAKAVVRAFIEAWAVLIERYIYDVHAGIMLRISSEPVGENLYRDYPVLKSVAQTSLSGIHKQMAQWMSTVEAALREIRPRESAHNPTGRLARPTARLAAVLIATQNPTETTAEIRAVAHGLLCETWNIKTVENMISLVKKGLSDVLAQIFAEAYKPYAEVLHATEVTPRQAGLFRAYADTIQAAGDVS